MKTIITPRRDHDRYRIYEAEKLMLEMVRRGDIHYQRTFERDIASSGRVPVKGRDPLRNARNNLLVLTTLVSRAAMEGGLSPEVAYALGDAYMQAAEDCDDLRTLEALAQELYRDFIYRVHELHSAHSVSHSVRRCCDAIEISLDRSFTLADLAELTGYSEDYISEKFRREMGMSMQQYQRKVRIDRAKLLLETTDRSVQELSEELGYNTPNYFIRCFRESTGETPLKYRQRMRAGREEA